MSRKSNERKIDFSVTELIAAAAPFETEQHARQIANNCLRTLYNAKDMYHLVGLEALNNHVREDVDSFLKSVEIQVKIVLYLLFYPFVF